MQIQEVFAPPHIITVQRLADEIWNEYYPSIIGTSQVKYMLENFQTAKSILQQIQEGYQYFILSDETVFGYMAIKKEGTSLFLSKIYIQKDYRRKGYAKKAIAFLKGITTKEGLQSITLTVNKNNIIAITAYKKVGFKKTGSLIKDIGNGFKMDDYSFELLCLNGE